jgi:hypothetical protein
MKTRLLASVVLLLAVPSFLTASSSSAIGDIVRAQVIINQVLQVVAKAKEVRAATGGGAAPAEPVAPEPLSTDNKAGKFFLPFDAEGNLTGWANKAITAQVGSAVGAKAGEKAGSMLASKVPMAGGLLAMGAKKKGKELGAIAAVGGAKFIKESSTYSFANVQDLALYMHLNCSSNTDYIKGFAAAMALYPDLEKTYEATVKKAYSAK